MRTASLFGVGVLLACVFHGTVVHAGWNIFAKKQQGTTAAQADKAAVDKSFTASVKRGASKAKSWMTPKSSVTPAADPIALSTKPIEPGADLYISMARLQEKSGNVPGAVLQYEKALKADPNNLAALLGYAHLQDREGRLPEATNLYERAIARHPKEAAAYNDLGLCYARRDMLDQSVAALSKAIELAPQRALYRNNIATVLIEQHRAGEALSHLTSAHGEAVANYNVGYLIAKKGDGLAARPYFVAAAAKDPSLTAARDWIARIDGRPYEPRIARGGPSISPQPGARPVAQPFGQDPARHNFIPQHAPRGVAPSEPPMPGDFAPSGVPAASSPPPVRYPQQFTTPGNEDAALPPLPDSLGNDLPAEEGPDLRLLPNVEGASGPSLWR